MSRRGYGKVVAVAVQICLALVLAVGSIVFATEEYMFDRGDLGGAAIAFGLAVLYLAANLLTVRDEYLERHDAGKAKPSTTVAQQDSEKPPNNT